MSAAIQLLKADIAADEAAIAQLLRRMSLAIPNIRPALIGQETYECLDELRRFRHVFRSAYRVDLDRNRLILVINHARRLQTLYLGDFSQFQKFLDQVSPDAA